MLLFLNFLIGIKVAEPNLFYAAPAPGEKKLDVALTGLFPAPIRIRGSRFLDFLDFQPAATSS
jgi:hypothetical protein